MTKEEKELLLKDLCARLLYGIKLKRKSKQFGEDIVLVDMYNFSYFLESTDFEHETIQLYLRPMSSMTEEELDLYRTLKWTKLEHEVVDWLNEHHFDYRGLIEKGLAIEAPEGMYNN